MTPQEKKANELVEKFQNIGLGYVDSIECSIITVDEIISEHLLDFCCIYSENRLKFWKEVKQELNEML